MLYSVKKSQYPHHWGISNQTRDAHRKISTHFQRSKDDETIPIHREQAQNAVLPTYKDTKFSNKYPIAVLIVETKTILSSFAEFN